jgi:hypothetical protein
MTDARILSLSMVGEQLFWVAEKIIKWYSDPRKGVFCTSVARAS